MSQISVPADSLPGESSLLGFRWPPLCSVLTRQSQRQLSGSSSYEGTNSIMKTPPLCLHLTQLPPKCPISKYHQIGVEALTYEFGRHSSIQTCLASALLNGIFNKRLRSSYCMPVTAPGTQDTSMHESNKPSTLIIPIEGEGHDTVVMINKEMV